MNDGPDPHNYGHDECARGYASYVQDVACQCPESKELLYVLHFLFFIFHFMAATKQLQSYPYGTERAWQLPSKGRFMEDAPKLNKIRNKSYKMPNALCSHHSSSTRTSKAKTSVARGRNPVMAVIRLKISPQLVAKYRTKFVSPPAVRNEYPFFFSPMQPWVSGIGHGHERMSVQKSFMKRVKRGLFGR